mmetsp:Transcript_28974/g.68912  ORF Transcript_28974/g.68912 Transcript_28974/m.68912 type:complete len:236 (-) Transcript_28974:2472-3179(-)
MEQLVHHISMHEVRDPQGKSCPVDPADVQPRDAHDHPEQIAPKVRPGRHSRVQSQGIRAIGKGDVAKQEDEEHQGVENHRIDHIPPSADVDVLLRHLPGRAAFGFALAQTCRRHRGRSSGSGWALFLGSLGPHRCHRHSVLQRTASEELFELFRLCNLAGRAGGDDAASGHDEDAIKLSEALDFRLQSHDACPIFQQRAAEQIFQDAQSCRSIDRAERIIEKHQLSLCIVCRSRQ